MSLTGIIICRRYMTTKIETITKKYTRSVNVDRQIQSFATELTASVEVASKEELVQASSKLFAQAKYLTEQDMKQNGLTV